jgi:hypothetical protein
MPLVPRSNYYMRKDDITLVDENDNDVTFDYRADYKA